MPLNEREINHTLLDYNYKIEYPDGREISTGWYNSYCFIKVSKDILY